MTEEVQFFHGTRQPFGRGGYLMPRTFHGGTDKTSAPLRPGYDERADSERFVYFTTSEELAWVYAWHAPGRGKPRVLRVIPCTPVQRDPEHSLDMEAYRAEMARVVEVRREPLVTEADARAGWVEAS